MPLLIAEDELLKRQARRKDIKRRIADIRTPEVCSPSALEEHKKKLNKLHKEYAENCSLIDYDIDCLRKALRLMCVSDEQAKEMLGEAAMLVEMDDSTRAIIEEMEEEAEERQRQEEERKQWEQERAEKAQERARAQMEKEAAERGESPGQTTIFEHLEQPEEDDAAAEGSDEGTEQTEDDSSGAPGERENVHSPERRTKSRSRRKGAVAG